MLGIEYNAADLLWLFRRAVGLLCEAPEVMRLQEGRVGAVVVDEICS